MALEPGHTILLGVNGRWVGSHYLGTSFGREPDEEFVDLLEVGFWHDQELSG